MSLCDTTCPVCGNDMDGDVNCRVAKIQLRKVQQMYYKSLEQWVLVPNHFCDGCGCVSFHFERNEVVEARKEDGSFWRLVAVVGALLVSGFMLCWWEKNQ